MKTAGIIMVVAGIIMLMFTGFKYVTKENVIDVGPVEINKEETHRVNWPPMAGGVLLVGGFLFLVAAKKGHS